MAARALRRRGAKQRFLRFQIIGQWKRRIGHALMPFGFVVSHFDRGRRGGSLRTLLHDDQRRRPIRDQIADHIRKNYPGQDIEVQDGGQPHYHFIISIE